MRENPVLRNLKSSGENNTRTINYIPGDVEKGWFQCEIWELKMSRRWGFSSWGTSQKWQRKVVMEPGSLGPQQPFLKLFFPFLRLYSFLSFLSCLNPLTGCLCIFLFSPTCILNANILQAYLSACFSLHTVSVNSAHTRFHSPACMSTCRLEYTQMSQTQHPRSLFSLSPWIFPPCENGESTLTRFSTRHEGSIWPISPTWVSFSPYSKLVGGPVLWFSRACVYNL